MIGRWEIAFNASTSIFDIGIIIVIMVGLPTSKNAVVGDSNNISINHNRTRHVRDRIRIVCDIAATQENCCWVFRWWCHEVPLLIGDGTIPLATKQRLILQVIPLPHKRRNFVLQGSQFVSSSLATLFVCWQTVNHSLQRILLPTLIDKLVPNNSHLHGSKLLPLDYHRLRCHVMKSLL
jgi:hypothetical protein